MKNVRSAHVFDLKLLKEFHLVFGKIHSIRELSIGEGNYHKKKKNNLTYFTWCSTPTYQQ